MDSFTLEKLEFGQVRRILARYCRCALGRTLVMRLSPSPRGETVQARLAETTQMVQALRDFGPPPYGGITDIRKQLHRARPGGDAGGEEFAAIVATLDGVGSVRRWCQGLREPMILIKELGAKLPEFTAESEAIHSVVDSRGRIMDTASATLSRTRRDITATRKKIHEVIYSYLHRPHVAKILQDPTVTLHEDRFVLPVKADRRHLLPGVVHRTSNTGATVFVEPSECVELNNRLAGLLDAERREIARLLNDLAITLEQRHEHVLSALQLLARIDLIAAKAQYAYQFEFTCPQINERGGLQLYQARHPLLIEQAYQQEVRDGSKDPKRAVVPIDVRLGMDFDVLIVTGSNTGGKTVALKTVALLAVMTQCGMHIPTERGSALPVFRNILLDVGDEQSLQQSLSTFGGHIRRVNDILRCADRYSLVLLDELGSGTDPDEGGAIGQAVLDEILRIGCLAMVSTHLSVLKAYAINHERVDNASVEFDTRTLRPTYRLRIGEPGESHAITVAGAIGMPKHIVSAASRHLTERDGAFRQAIRATTATRRKSEAARSEARSAQLAAEAAEESYESRRAAVQRLQEDFQNWLASLAEAQPGEEVYIPRMKRTGKLVRLQLNKQIAVVDVDNVQVEVPLAELMPDLGQSGARREIATTRKRILAQASETESLRAQAERLQEEYQHSLARQRARQQQFDRWLAEIGRVKVGQIVTIAREPGKGKLVELDLRSSRAKVETEAGTIELPLQELFPQVGPFAQDRGEGRGRSGTPEKSKRPKDRPIRHPDPNSPAAQSVRQAILKTLPGEEVYVVPFNKRARLIRFNHEKDEAIVRTGAFEMQVRIADLEPVREKR